MANVMISCGEASGDLYAGALTTALKRLQPDVHVTGLGGERLRAAGADLVGDYRGLAVTGLVEALRVLPRAWRVQQALVARAKAERPDALVVIDFPDFNFRLASKLQRLGVPVVYYICPQVWAWRRGRLGDMKRFVDRALVIFPFEEAIYRETGIPVRFVGHPLLDLAEAGMSRDETLACVGFALDAPTIALLPGSRPNELRSILPTILKALPLIVARLPRAQFLVARAPNLADELFAPVAAVRRSVRIATLDSRADDVLRAADVVITASGTATVQTAIHERPMVIVYRVSPMSYRLGKPFVNVSTYGMANLIAGERIVPELIQDGFTAEAVAAETLRYFDDPAYAARTRDRLRDVRAALGAPGASRRAAEQVLEVCALAGKLSAP
jgi:lipid-A-disaccharide synthase